MGISKLAIAKAKEMAKARAKAKAPREAEATARARARREAIFMARRVARGQAAAAAREIQVTVRHGWSGEVAFVAATAPGRLVHVLLDAAIDHLALPAGRLAPDLCLLFAGQQLEWDRTLADHNIWNDCELQLVMRPPRQQFYVRRAGGGWLVIYSYASDTIASVKALVQDLEDIPPHHQRLTFAGQLLEDEQACSNYRIAEGSELQLSDARLAW